MNEEKKFWNCDFKNYPMWKKVLVVILAYFVISWIFGMGYKGHKYYPDMQKDTIVVSGKGEISVKPDIATLSFSVMEENLDVSKATDVVNTKIANIVDSLDDMGVDEKDVKTTDYSIYPRYDYVNAVSYPYVPGRQVLAGYTITQSITIKIRDLSKAGEIVTNLGTLGVTNMSGLNFTNDKYDDLVKEARDKAILEARMEAKGLARSLGVRLVKIVGYSEGGDYPVYNRAMTSAMSFDAESSAKAVLPTGENMITSNVSITYEIR